MTCIHFCQTSVTFLFNVIILEMDLSFITFSKSCFFFILKERGLTEFHLDEQVVKMYGRNVFSSVI